jgi:hypothetical protein
MYVIYWRKFLDHKKLDLKILTDLHLFSTLITEVVSGMTSVCVPVLAARWMDVGLATAGKIYFMFSI